MIIYGASGHGKVIAEILEENGITNIVFVDDGAIGNTFLDYPCVGKRAIFYLAC